MMTAAREGSASKSMLHWPGPAGSRYPVTPISAKGSFSSPCLKLIRPASTLMRLKRSAVEAPLEFCDDGFGAPCEAAPDVAESLGSHSAKFQSPSALRTRLRLGRLREIVPNSKCPRSKLCQRRPIVRESACRKYS